MLITSIDSTPSMEIPYIFNKKEEGKDDVGNADVAAESESLILRAEISVFLC